MNVWEMIKSGRERVAKCRDCGCESTSDIRGLNAFTNVLRAGGLIEVCRECAAIDTWGTNGMFHKMVEGIKTPVTGTRTVTVLPDVHEAFDLTPRTWPFHPVKVVCFPAMAPTAAELEAHAALVRDYLPERR